MNRIVFVFHRKVGVWTELTPRLLFTITLLFSFLLASTFRPCTCSTTWNIHHRSSLGRSSTTATPAPLPSTLAKRGPFALLQPPFWIWSGSDTRSDTFRDTRKPDILRFRDHISLEMCRGCCGGDRCSRWNSGCCRGRCGFKRWWYGSREGR